MIVLDTHALIWMDVDDPRLGPSTRQRIAQDWGAGAVAVCAISFWECAALHRRGRIGLRMAPTAWREELLTAGLIELPIDGGIGMAAALLEGLHKDPADRFIAAAALVRGATLVTADARLLAWENALERLDASA